jgi:hypothetical protein
LLATQYRGAAFFLTCDPSFDSSCEATKGEAGSQKHRDGVEGTDLAIAGSEGGFRTRPVKPSFAPGS